MTATAATMPLADRNGRQAVVEGSDLEVRFRLRVPAGHGLVRRSKDLAAIDGVSVAVAPGETVGLVGESGSGKSTTGRALLRLVDVTRGVVSWRGEDVTHRRQSQIRPLRRQVQLVSQDPYSSLDPSATVANIVGEPLRVHLGLRGREHDDRVAELLGHVGLSRRELFRYPDELSGGQRQRVALARAIALEPGFIVLDEAVSALDVSTQNQILQLLARLQDDLGVAYLFISHNLPVVGCLAQRTLVMYLGKLVEEGPTVRVRSAPAHPYTQSLLAAVPLPDPVRQRARARLVLTGETPSPLDPPSGCRFRTRCPHAMPVCAEVEPKPMPVEGGGWATCHLLGATGTTGPP
jgi:peptide/nickel transport system ATP-binding protein